MWYAPFNAGHDGDDLFGPDSEWAYWFDNAEDDKAFEELQADDHGDDTFNVIA
jgi:hypothetical protein